MRSRPDNFLSAHLLSTYRIRYIKTVPDIKLLADKILLLKQSVCMARIKAAIERYRVEPL